MKGPKCKLKEQFRVWANPTKAAVFAALLPLPIFISNTFRFSICKSPLLDGNIYHSSLMPLSFFYCNVVYLVLKKLNWWFSGVKLYFFFFTPMLLFLLGWRCMILLLYVNKISVLVFLVFFFVLCVVRQKTYWKKKVLKVPKKLKLSWVKFFLEILLVCFYWGVS